MRIGYDGKFLWQGRTMGSRSGHGIQTRELLDGLLTQGDEHEFSVYLLHAESGLTQRGNLSSVVLPRIARSSAARNLVAYAVELRRSPVDVLLSYSVVPKFLPCPSVLILDDISFIAHDIHAKGEGVGVARQYQEWNGSTAAGQGRQVAVDVVY